MIRVLIGWGPAALWAAVLFLLSAIEDTGGPTLPIPDKVLHVGVYVPLGVALWWARDCIHPRIGGWVFVALGLLYGVSDEWHQSFVPGRDPSFGDWVADGVGVVLGYSVAHAVLARRASPETKRTN